MTERGQRQFGLSLMTGLQAYGSTVTEPGTGSAIDFFHGYAGDGILRVHILRRNVPRVVLFQILAGMPARGRQRQQQRLTKKKGLPAESEGPEREAP